MCILKIMNTNKRDLSTMEEEGNLNDILNELLPGTSDSIKDESEVVSKRFLSLDEFLNFAALNKVTVQDDSFPDTVMITDLDIIECATTLQLTQEEFTSFLDDNSTIKKNSNLRVYNSTVYEFISIIILNTFAVKFSDQSDVLNLIGLIVNIIPHHKQNSKYALKEFNKMIQYSKEVSISSQTVKDLMRNFINKNFKRQKVEVETIVDVDKNAFEVWFSDTHSQLYDDVVKPFMNIGWFFNNIAPISMFGFNQISRSTVKTKDDGSIQSLKLTMTKPLFVRVSSKIVKKGFKMMDLPSSVSSLIIECITRDVRFHDAQGLNIKLDYFEGVNICNPQAALVYNLYAPGSMYPHHESTVNWNIDILDSNIDVYMSFNSLHLVYGDDANKISIKLYPNSFNSSIQSTSRVCMVSIPRKKTEQDTEE